MIIEILGSQNLPTLQEILSQWTVEVLKAYAKLCLPNPPTRKAELVERLGHALTHEPTLKQFWNQLSPLEQEVVSAAVAQGGVLNEMAFRAQHGSVPTEKLRVPMSFYSWNFKPNPVALDMFMFGKFIPRDMLPLLRRFVPAPQPYVLPTLPKLPAKLSKKIPLQTVDTEHAALHDVVATLRLISEGKLGVGAKTGRPSTAVVTRLNERLLIGDYFELGANRGEEAIRPYGLALLVQATKLAQVEGNKLVLTRKGEQWLRQPSIEALRALWETWVSSNQIDELSRIRAIRGQQAQGTQLTPPSQRKLAIMTALRSCPPDVWIDLQDFSRAMRIWGYTFEMEYTPYSNLFLGDYSDYGSLNSVREYWTIVNFQYVLVVLWEFAASFGLIDVAYTYPHEAGYLDDVVDFYDGNYLSRYDGLRFMRINSLGAYLLGLTPNYTPSKTSATTTPFVVLVNLDVAVTEPQALLPNDRTLLERITTLKTENVYTLDRERLLQAVGEGLSFDLVDQFLRSHSQQPLPATVETWLTDLRRNSSRLVARGAAVVFAVDDPIFARQLANDTTLKRYCLLTGESLLTVWSEHEAAFRRRLRQLGYGITTEKVQPESEKEQAETSATRVPFAQVEKGKRKNKKPPTIIIDGEIIEG